MAFCIVTCICQFFFCKGAFFHRTESDFFLFLFPYLCPPGLSVRLLSPLYMGIFNWNSVHRLVEFDSFLHLTPPVLTEFDMTEYRFPWDICNGCGMLTGGAYSSGHLVLSPFGTCMCSNVEINLSLACLVSGRLNFEHPSVLLLCLSWEYADQEVRMDLVEYFGRVISLLTWVSVCITSDCDINKMFRYLMHLY